MKINKILFLVLCLTLVSCNEGNQGSEIESFESVESFDTEEETFESSESLEESESIESEPFSLKCEDFPTPVAGGYPEEGNYQLGELNFYLKDVMQNTGKYSPINTVQMKKEGSYLYNEDPIYGLSLTITVMKNVVEYNNQVMHTAPTVYLSDETTFNNVKASVSEEEQSDRVIYTYLETKDYSHVKIVNESSYAQYLFEISFA